MKTCSASEDGLALIQEYEGYMPFTYKDLVGINTIGFGHVVRQGEKFPQPLIPEDAAILLKKDAKISSNGLNRCTKVPLYQSQADACISFIFNLGADPYCSSTLLKKINAKKHTEVPEQFLKWDKARVNGRLVSVSGLHRRRQAEASLYIKEKDH